MKPRLQQQMLLDLGPAAAPPTLNNFAVGDNRELMAHLKSLGESSVFDQIYLWGSPGCGRSHLLQGSQIAAQAEGRHVCFVQGADLGHELSTPPGSLVIVDDVDHLDETAQITLFRIFNSARLVGLALLLAGDEPPLRLKLREDLRTRIGATLIFEVRPLNDVAKAQALRHHAKHHGLRLDDPLIDYMLHHGKRDLPSLIKVLEAASQLSLELKRPLTLPMLREAMATFTPPQDAALPHENESPSS